VKQVLTDLQSDEKLKDAYIALGGRCGLLHNAVQCAPSPEQVTWLPFPP